tara:strand:- start:309 stop:683 length:375 start_codon:yes stop_codon:yes gene_type:complete
MFEIPVSNGEIVDKFTILNIKLNKINDSKKIIYIKKELCFLNKYVNEITTKYKIEELIDNLQIINEKLWKLEDCIRNKEKLQEFDKEFITTSRNIYKNNDIRCNIKLKINKITNSELCEVKYYK